MARKNEPSSSCSHTILSIGSNSSTSPFSGGGYNGGGNGYSQHHHHHSTALSSGMSQGRNDQGSGEFSLTIEHVKNGLDKRTTLMIRNIPNKYTQHMLLAEINHHHHVSRSRPSQTRAFTLAQDTNLQLTLPTRSNMIFFICRLISKTSAIWATHLLTLSSRLRFCPFIKNSAIKNGTTSIVKRYVRFLMLDFKAKLR